MVETQTPVEIRLATFDPETREVIPAVRVPGGASHYRLLHSPGAAEGAAVGDTISLNEDGTFNVISRSGYVSVQLFADFPEALPTALQLLTPRIEALGGYLDGRTSSTAVYSVHIHNGLETIAEAIIPAVARFPGLHWMFGNVYDELDAPLNWWR